MKKINNSHLLYICFCCVFISLLSCNKVKKETIKDIPFASVNDFSQLLNLAIKPKSVQYILKKKKYPNKRIDIGPNDEQNYNKFLVSVSEYSTKDISTIQKELDKSNRRIELNLLYKIESYQDWLPLEIKKRFRKSNITGSIEVTSPVFTLDKYFNNSTNIKNNGFCFIEGNFLYLYIDY